MSFIAKIAALRSATETSPSAVEIQLAEQALSDAADTIKELKAQLENQEHLAKRLEQQNKKLRADNEAKDKLISHVEAALSVKSQPKQIEAPRFNNDVARTADDWYALGFIMKKGVRHIERNQHGQCLFAPCQVRHRDW